MNLTRRRFDPITVPAEGGRRRVRRVTCSRCETHHDVSANTHGGARAMEDLLKVWRRAGWEIASNPEHDVCPTCSSIERKARREKTSKQTTAEIIPMPAQQPAPQPVAATDAPAGPSREDRRIVFAKLQEVYLDERTGYAPGWTDKKVAEDLGVPRAWVEHIRDENFGPEKSNEDVRRAIAEAEDFIARARAAIEEAEKDHAHLENLSRGLATVTKEVTTALAASTARKALLPTIRDEAARIERSLRGIEKALLP